MNKPSNTYYFFSALFGLFFGGLLLIGEFRVWLKYIETGEIIFKFKKYQFECMSECAVLSHLTMLIFGLCFLVIGLSAVIKLWERYKNPDEY